VLRGQVQSFKNVWLKIWDTTARVPPDCSRVPVGRAHPCAAKRLQWRRPDEARL